MKDGNFVGGAPRINPEAMNIQLNKDYLTTEEAAMLLGVSERTIRRKKALFEYKTVKRPGGFRLLLKADSVLKTLEPIKKVQLLQKAGLLQTKTACISQSITDKQKEIALAKDALLRAYEASFEGLKHGSIKPAKLQFVEAYNTGELMPGVFKKLGERSFKTIERWLKEWRQAERQPMVLAPGYNYKETFETTLSEYEKRIFLDLLLQPQQIKISKAYKLTKYMLEKKGIIVTASEATYRRFAKEFERRNKELYTLMRRGEKALRDTILPYIKRDTSMLKVGDVFVADGKKTTFDVINPHTGKRCKATFVAYLDWASYDIAGWELMITESTQSVTSALRNGIIRLGKKPKIAYQDNGRAFRNRFFNGSKINFEELGWSGLFASLGITAVYSIPYNARAKVIELRWKEMVETFEKLLPSFTGTSPVDKPAYMMRNEKFHKRYHEVLTGNYVPTLLEAKELIEIWLEFYRSQPHPHKKEKTIGQVFNEGRGSGVDVSELNDLMMKWGDKPLPVRRNGVKILSGDYYSEALTPLVGEKVWVKYSLSDISEVVVTDLAGRFICRAQRRASVHAMAYHLGTPKDVEELKAQLKQQKRLEAEALKQGRELMKRHERTQFYQLPETKAYELGEETEEEKIYTFFADKEEDENKKAAEA